MPYGVDCAPFYGQPVRLKGMRSELLKIQIQHLNKRVRINANSLPTDTTYAMPRDVCLMTPMGSSLSSSATSQSPPPAASVSRARYAAYLWRATIYICYTYYIVSSTWMCAMIARASNVHVSRWHDTASGRGIALKVCTLRKIHAIAHPIVVCGGLGIHLWPHKFDFQYFNITQNVS